MGYTRHPVGFQDTLLEFTQIIVTVSPTFDFSRSYWKSVVWLNSQVVTQLSSVLCQDIPKEEAQFETLEAPLDEDDGSFLSRNVAVEDEQKNKLRAPGPPWVSGRCGFSQWSCWTGRRSTRNRGPRGGDGGLAGKMGNSTGEVELRMFFFIFLRLKQDETGIHSDFNLVCSCFFFLLRQSQTGLHSKFKLSDLRRRWVPDKPLQGDGGPRRPSDISTTFWGVELM